MRLNHIIICYIGFLILECCNAVKIGEPLQIKDKKLSLLSSFNITLNKITEVPEMLTIDSFCIVPDLQMQQFKNYTGDRYTMKDVSHLLKSTKSPVSDMNTCAGTKYCNNGGMAGAASSCSGSKNSMVSIDCIQGVYQDAVNYIYESSVQTLKEAKNIIDDASTKGISDANEVIQETLDGFNKIMNGTISKMEAITIQAISDSSAKLTYTINKNIEQLRDAVQSQFEHSNKLYEDLTNYILTTNQALNKRLNSLELYSQTTNDILAKNAFAELKSIDSIMQTLNQIMVKVMEMSLISSQGVNISPLLSQWYKYVDDDIFQEETNNTYTYYSDTIIGVYPNTSELYETNRDIISDDIYKCYFSRINPVQNSTILEIREILNFTTTSLPIPSVAYKGVTFYYYDNDDGSVDIANNVNAVNNYPIYRQCFLADTNMIATSSYELSDVRQQKIFLNASSVNNSKLYDTLGNFIQHNITIEDIERIVQNEIPINNILYYENFLYISNSREFESKYLSKINVKEIYRNTTYISINKKSQKVVDYLSLIGSLHFVRCLNSTVFPYNLSPKPVDCNTGKTIPRDVYEAEGDSKSFKCPYDNYMINNYTKRIITTSLPNEYSINDYILLDHDVYGAIRIEKCELAGKSGMSYMSDSLINEDYGMVSNKSKIVNTQLNGYNLGYKFMRSMGDKNGKYTKVITGNKINNITQKVDIDMYYYTKDIWCCDDNIKPVLTVNSSEQCIILEYHICPSKSVDNVAYYKSPRIYYCTETRKYSEPYGIEIVPCLRTAIRLPGRGVLLETNIMSPSGLYPAHCIFWNSVKNKIPKYRINFEGDRTVIPTYINDLIGKEIIYYINGTKVIDEMDKLYGVGNSGYDCINYDMDLMTHIPTNCLSTTIPSYDSVAYFSSKVRSSGLSKYMDFFDIVPGTVVNASIVIELRLKDGIDYPVVYINKMAECPILNVKYHSNNCEISGWSRSNYVIMINDFIVNDNSTYKPSVILNNEESYNITIIIGEESLICNNIKCISSMNVTLAYPPSNSFVIDRPNKLLEDLNVGGISMSNQIDIMSKTLIDQYLSYVDKYKAINDSLQFTFVETNMTDILNDINKSYNNMRNSTSSIINNTKTDVDRQWKEQLASILTKGDSIYNDTLGKLQEIRDRYGNKTFVGHSSDSSWNINLMAGFGVAMSAIVIIVVIVIICCVIRR